MPTSRPLYMAMLGALSLAACGGDSDSAGDLAPRLDGSAAMSDAGPLLPDRGLARDGAALDDAAARDGEAPLGDSGADRDAAVDARVPMTPGPALTVLPSHGAVIDHGKNICWLQRGDIVCSEPPSTQGTLFRPGPFVSFSTSYDYTCALRTEGSLSCFGEAFRSDATCHEEDCLNGERPPPGTYMMVHVQGDKACAVTTGGELRCWGDDYNSPDRTPPSGSDFVAVSVASATACALRSSGAVACWGSLFSDVRSAEPFTSGVAQLAMGGLSSACFLMTDGSTLCPNSFSPTQERLEHIVQIAGSATSLCGLDAAGGVHCVGNPELVRGAVAVTRASRPNISTSVRSMKPAPTVWCPAWGHSARCGWATPRRVASVATASCAAGVDASATETAARPACPPVRSCPATADRRSATRCRTGRPTST